MRDDRAFFRVFFILLLFGCLSLLGMLARPTVAAIRGVDIVHLIGTGMCFGAAIMALAAGRRGVS